MMTEEEAKTKWCPFSRQLDAVYTNVDGIPTAGGTVNRDYVGNPHNQCLCIGSKCMAWRIKVYTLQLSRGGKPVDDSWVSGIEYIAASGKEMTAWHKKHGYCGLVGLQND